jgi:hypothetical protein
MRRTIEEVICDHCATTQAQLTARGQGLEITQVIVSMRGETLHYDLCPHCMRELAGFLRGANGPL